LGRKRKSEETGYHTGAVTFTNIYHECLRKLLEECSEAQGDCTGCPVQDHCLEWWSQISQYGFRGVNCYLVNTENFPYLVLQFLKFREKSREKTRLIIKLNGNLYQKELASAKH